MFEAWPGHQDQRDAQKLKTLVQLLKTQGLGSTWKRSAAGLRKLRKGAKTCLKAAKIHVFCNRTPKKLCENLAKSLRKLELHQYFAKFLSICTILLRGEAALPPY